MSIYFFLVGLFLFLSFIIRCTSPSNVVCKKEAFFCGIILVLCASLRAVTVGSDTSHYIEYLNYISGLDWESFFAFAKVSPQEIGYLLLTKIFLFISEDEHFFIFWTSSLALIPVIWFICKYSSYPAISMIIYILSTDYLYALGVVRHSIALGLILIAYSIMLDKKKKSFIKSIIVCITAIFFHKSAFVGLIVIIINQFTNIRSYKIYFISIAALGLLFLFKNSFGRLLIYLKPSAATSIASGIEWGWGRILISGSMLLLTCLYGYLSIDDKNYDFWKLLCFFTFVLKILSFQYYLFSRAANFCSVSYWFILPSIMRNIEKRNSMIICFAVIICFTVFFAIGFDAQYTYVLWE